MSDNRQAVLQQCDSRYNKRMGQTRLAMKRFLMSPPRLVPIAMGIALIGAIFSIWALQPSLGKLVIHPPWDQIGSWINALSTSFWVGPHWINEYTPSPLFNSLLALGHTLWSSPWMPLLLTLGLALTAWWTMGQLAMRLFHEEAAQNSVFLLLACWGFFVNALTPNGAMGYVILVVVALGLFFTWFDAAYRSRTLAKSLYSTFIALGVVLGLAFWAFGLPGVLFPLAIMGTTLWVSQKTHFVDDIPHAWLWGPFGFVVLLGITLGLMVLGVGPFLQHLFPFQFRLEVLLKTLDALLPIGFLLLPGLLTKDIWNRAFVTYPKSVYLLGSWLLWSVLFGVLFGGFSTAFTLLAILPLVLWLGFYLGEVFRNPILPKGLQLTLDFMGILMFLVCLGAIWLTFQVVPDDQRWLFVLVALLLPVIAVTIFILKDRTISRNMLLYIVPSGMALCGGFYGVILPWIQFTPEKAFAPRLAQLPKAQHVLIWQPLRPLSTIALGPMPASVQPVSTPAALEAFIQTRPGTLHLVLPEAVYYRLPWSVRESAFVSARSWHWRQPMTLSLALVALTHETLDFDALTEPVFWVTLPAEEN